MRPLTTLSLLLWSTLATQAATPASLRFDFGSGPLAEGCNAVSADTVYSSSRGFGLVSSAGISSSSATNASDPVRADALVSDKPFSFVVDLPEGNYDVTVLLGDPAAAANTTVKAETRRLMIESVATASGLIEARTFTVNVRNASLPGGRRVGLKERELATFHWDDKLIIEFNGARPAVAGLEIKRNDSALTVFLAGDSTVTDQPGEPWCAWGQMLPRFFPAGVAVSNHAESGLSLASFRGSGRLEKMRGMIKPGDYVLIQFGHNDQKEKGDGVGAFTTYASSLRDYIESIREKGGIPVLVTSMYRRRFSGGTLTDTLGDFPAAVRLVAEEQKVPCIDLHAMSARLFSALGPELSKKAFVHFPAGAYPGNAKDVKDDTHFSAYGAYELARCIVQGMRGSVPALAARLAPDVTSYNPDFPGEPAAFSIPPSPAHAEVRIPDGDGR